MDGGKLETSREAHTPAKTKVRWAVFGCTNVCNASCVHCPTGKAETEHLDRGSMSMAQFCSLIDELAEQCIVTDSIMFGLFGDSLADPLIVDRARYVREKLPDAALQLNSNGAAYSRAKHAALADIVNSFNLHIESLRPDVYDFIMQPLRLERVAPKIEMILRDFGHKVSVGVPLHRLNLSERQTITDYFLDRGAGGVFFGPLQNRCSSSGPFEQLAFSPAFRQCRSDILNDLVVDWDGLVLACCNDFRRQHPIGDLRTTSLREVLDGPARRAFARKLDAGEWDSLKTCSTCRWDICDQVGDGVHSPAEEKPLDPAVELRAVYASSSWRLTAPLRAFRRAFSR